MAGSSGGELCSEIARELAHIERSGCLRYLKVDYSALDRVCTYRRLLGSAGERLYTALSSVKRASEGCSRLQEAPDALKEDIYGSIYLEVKRALDLLEEEGKELGRGLGRLRRVAIGSSASLLLLDAALFMVAPQDLLVIALLITVAVFSALNMALSSAAPRLSTSIPVALGLLLLASSFEVGDPAKLSASAALLAVLIILQLYR